MGFHRLLLLVGAHCRPWGSKLLTGDSLPSDDVLDEKAPRRHDVTVTVTPFGPTCPTVLLSPQDLAHPGTHIFIMFFALGTSGRGIQLLSNPLPDDVFGSRIQMVPMLFAVELGVVLHKINQHQLIVLFPVLIGDIFLRCPNPFLLDTFFFTRWVCLGVL